MSSLIDKLLSPIFTIWRIFRSLFIAQIRTRGKYVTILYELLLKEGKNLILYDEIGDVALPISFISFSIVRGIPLYFNISERVLRAGLTGTDTIASITIFRWQKRKLIKLLEDNIVKDDAVPVYLLQEWDSEKIGELSFIEKPDKPYLPLESYLDIEHEIRLLEQCKIKKTGIILYGKPGNGKTFLVRYFALKYKLPIYIVSVTPDTNNHTLIRMFSRIRGPAIVLFEDFDNYFDGRKSLLKDCHFTLDTILNILDGVFSSMSHIAFFLTANYIKKIDDSLKDRPSRFKFVKEINYPNIDIRCRIFKGLLNKEKLVSQFAGKNLDYLLTIAEKEKKNEKEE